MKNHGKPRKHTTNIQINTYKQTNTRKQKWANNLNKRTKRRKWKRKPERKHRGCDAKMKRTPHLALFVSFFLSLFKCIFISHLCHETVAILKMTVALPSEGIHSTRLNVRSDVAHLRTFFSSPFSVPLFFSFLWWIC